MKPSQFTIVSIDNQQVEAVPHYLPSNRVLDNGTYRTIPFTSYNLHIFRPHEEAIYATAVNPRRTLAKVLVSGAIAVVGLN